MTVKTASGKWTTVKPVVSAKGRLKALAAIVNGKEEKHPEEVAEKLSRDTNLDLSG